jgi:hypothetical protein
VQARATGKAARAPTAAHSLPSMMQLVAPQTRRAKRASAASYTRSREAVQRSSMRPKRHTASASAHVATNRPKTT